MSKMNAGTLKVEIIYGPDFEKTLKNAYRVANRIVREKIHDSSNKKSVSQPWIEQNQAERKLL